MELALLLGSGVSFASELPDVRELTRRVMSEPLWGSPADDRFHRGQPHGQFVELANPVAVLRSFLRLLYEDAERYLGDRERGEPTYEDLFYLAKQIQRERGRAYLNPAVAPYVDSVEARSVEIRAEYWALLRSDESREPAPLLDIAVRAADFIDSVVRSSLHHDGPVAGLDLIGELARHPEVSRLHIATLNHDTLAEQYLEKQGIPFTDGFGPRDGDVRWFSPAAYDDADDGVILYKLHGSIDWYHFFGQGSDVHGFAKSYNPDIEHNETAAREMLVMTREGHVLTGTDKDLYYHWNVFAEVHSRFYEALRSCRRLVTSGYGFADHAVNGRLSSWLDRDDGNSVVLLNAEPETIREQPRTFTQSGVPLWEQSGRFLIHRMWMQDAHLEDIKQAL